MKASREQSPPPSPPPPPLSSPTRVESTSSVLIGEGFSDSDHFEVVEPSSNTIDTIPSGWTNAAPSRPAETNLNSRRPPLPPTANSPKRKSQDTQRPHLDDRAISQGDMSALTDPLLEICMSPDEKPTEAKHTLCKPRAVGNRGVSWGIAFNPASQQSQSILQPVLTNNEGDRQQPPVVPLLPRRLLSGQNARSARIIEKLSMAEILDPIESEAETAILAALENRDKESTNKVETSSFILPNMTLDAVARWKSSPIRDSASDGNHQSGDVATPLVDDASASTPMNPETKEGTTTAAHSCKPVPLRAASSRRAMMGQKDGKPPLVAKRTTTVSSMETTLSTLTTMMRNIHHQEIPVSPSGGEEGVLTTQLSPKRSEETLKTQYDSLANNAALLFRAAGRMSGDPANDPKKNDDAVPLVNQGVEMDTHPNNKDDIENGAPVVPFDGCNMHKNRIQKSGRTKQMLRKGVSAAKEDWESICDFLRAQKMTFYSYIKAMMFYIMLPSTAIAAILFYVFSNPLMKIAQHPTSNEFPSVSWFLLFLCVRQAITFSMARATEIIVVDLIALKTGVMINLIGPILTLVVVQSKGWPFTITWWAIYDLCMLSGDHDFVNHWLYYQDIISLFNDKNPGGNVTNSEWNFRILYVALVVGIVVGIKRFAVGLYLGGRQYAAYGAKLSAVMHQMIVVSEVARLARKLESEELEEFHEQAPQIRNSVIFAHFDDVIEDDEDEFDDHGQDTVGSNAEADIAAGERPAYDRVMSASDKFRIAKMLDSWEEPPDDRRVDAVTIGGILQFKQSLTFMDLSYPFSKAFGLADCREQCVRSAEELFHCLVQNRSDRTDALHFETLSVLARDRVPGEFDETKLKDLVRVFRPERDGTLSLIEFIRSIDRVYKDFKLLRASIRNSGCIDQAFEAIINVAFYFLVFCVVLLSWGIDPLKMFLSLSSVILAFSFAIGSASAKYFEGLMFIILRTPYDIGDRISIDGPNDRPGMDGVFTWFVEDVTLYFTTVRLGATNEWATISNSSLAQSRIVNAARSHKAVVYINLKFGIYVPYEKIQVFKDTVETFIKARPREWLSCNAIRATRVESDLGYVAYAVVLQHRDSWQHVGAVLESKAQVMSFCLEVQKQLGMRYVAPPTPVDLTIRNVGQSASNSERNEPFMTSDQSTFAEPRNRTQSEDLRGVASMFPSEGNS